MVYRHDYDHPSYYRPGIGGYRDPLSRDRGASRGLLAAFVLMAAIFLILAMVSSDPEKQGTGIQTNGTSLTEPALPR